MEGHCAGRALEVQKELRDTGVCGEKSSGDEDRWEHELLERQTRGLIAVSAAGPHGQGSHQRSVLFTGTGTIVFLLRIPAISTESLDKA